MSSINYAFNEKEQEICVFLSAIEILKNAVNRDMLSINNGMENVCVRPNGLSQEKLFLALSVDLISEVGDIFSGKKQSTLDLLKCISDMSFLSGTELPKLKIASQQLLDWLDEKSVYRNINFSYKSLERNLLICNRDVVRICGNSGKHNLNRLDSVRKILGRIFADNKVSDIITNNKDLIFLLQDFNNVFVGDGGLIGKYINCLSYFMNELEWAIYYSLRPVFDKYCFCEIVNGIRVNKYRRPDGLSEEGYWLFWDLMNENSREPYIPRFKIMDVWLRAYAYV